MKVWLLAYVQHIVGVVRRLPVLATTAPQCSYEEEDEGKPQNQPEHDASNMGWLQTSIEQCARLSGRVDEGASHDGM